MKRYDSEFKSQLIKEAQETGNVSMVARKHSVSIQTLSSWIRKAEAPSDTDASRKKVRELKKELNASKLENEILKELLKKTNQAWLGVSPLPGASSSEVKS